MLKPILIACPICGKVTEGMRTSRYGKEDYLRHPSLHLKPDGSERLCPGFMETVKVEIEREPKSNGV